MADMMSFNTQAGAAVARKLLILYLNTGTSEAPVWSAIGKRVEDSSMEFDWGEESKTDIFGNTYTNVNAPIITQTFEPWELDSADAAQKKIWNKMTRTNDEKFVRVFLLFEDPAALDAETDEKQHRIHEQFQPHGVPVQ